MPAYGAGLVRPPIFTPGGSPSQTARGGAGTPITSASRRAASPPSVLVSATVQDVYPPRVLVSVTGLATWVTTGITVYRQVAGVRTAIRGAGGITLAGDDSFVRVDAELPFGVPITWVAVLTQANGATFEAVSAPLTVTLPGGKAALSDAITGQASEVVISAWPEKRTGRVQTTFIVGGRTVVVSGNRGDFTATIEVVIESDSARDAFTALLDGCTSGVLQLRQSGGYGGVDAYLSVQGDTETRWSQDGSDQRRLWSLEVAQVQAWPALFEARGFTLQDIADRYVGLTLTDLSIDYKKLLALSLGDFST